MSITISEAIDVFEENFLGGLHIRKEKKIKENVPARSEVIHVS